MGYTGKLYAVCLVGIACALCGCGREVHDSVIPLKVKVFSAQAGGEGADLYYSGVIEPRRSVSVSFLTSGTVAEVNVREGDRISSGRLMARLDCRTNENALQSALAGAVQADDAFARFEPMYKNGNLPEIRMVEIETAKTRAALAVRLARKNVDDCSINAPESGIVSERNIEPGDSSGPGIAAFKVVSVDKVYASVAVPEQEIASVKKGAPASVKIEGAGSGFIRGTVRDVGVVPDPLGRAYTVRVLLDNSARRVLPGMLCDVFLGGRISPEGFVVPAEALKLDGNGKQYVYLVNADKKVYRQPVAVSGFRKNGVLITSGLRAGDTVVTDGGQKISDGSAVEPEF